MEFTNHMKNSENFQRQWKTVKVPNNDTFPTATVTSSSWSGITTYFFYRKLKCKITSTFLVSPASDKAGCSSRHHSPRLGQADRADLLGDIYRLDQMHQGYVIGDVSAILLVDEPLVPDDTVHLIAFLCWGNIHGRVHLVLPQTHTPVGGFIQWAGKQVVGWRWKLELVLLFHLAIVQVGSQDKMRKNSCFKELLSSLQKQTFLATWGHWKPVGNTDIYDGKCICQSNNNTYLESCFWPSCDK